MGRYLMLDVGAGTLDILYYNTEKDLHYKAVVRSPVRVLAEQIKQTKGNLLITGGEMGGGPVSQVLIERAATHEVVMTKASAATIHHNRKRVLAKGIRVVEEDEAEALKGDARFQCFRTKDIQPERLRQIVTGFGVPFDFDAVAICAQDHGVAPTGVSHLDFRHRMFTQVLDRTPSPQALLYEAEKVPEVMNRLRAIGSDALLLPTKRIYVMDSGMAAILGASMDTLVRDLEKIIVLDIATSHTVAAAIEDGTLCGFFEYHTKDVTVDRMDRLLADLAEGNLSHDKILKEGGHGAYIRHAFGLDQVERILATGPRRKLITGSSKTIFLGAPWGDNMMTGTVGLMEAVRLREGLPPISYL